MCLRQNADIPRVEVRGDGIVRACDVTRSGSLKLITRRTQTYGQFSVLLAAR
jgi:hypothetical protein